MMVAVTTIKKKILMNLFPFNIAILAPSIPPAALQTAIGTAI